MIKIKNKAAIAKMRIGGQLLESVVESIASRIKPGCSTLELDTYLDEHMEALGLVAVCKQVPGYRHASCISVNDVVVHGVPSESVILKEGDLVKIDIVGSYRDYCVDMARSFFVGTPSSEALRLVETAQRALDAAIECAQVGRHLSDISAAVQHVVESAGYGVVRCFAGHGIGKELHEDPEIPNYGKPGRGPRLQSGMVLAIEPMITQGDWAVKIDDDGWTARTKDGSLAGHVEDTVAITEQGPEILTRSRDKKGYTVI